MASSIEDVVRDSVETQTNYIDDEVVRQKVGELRGDLNQLNINNAYLRSGLQTQGDKLLTMKDYQAVLSSTMSEFLGTMSELRKKILEHRKESRQFDQEIGSLREEKGWLSLLFRFIYLFIYFWRTSGTVCNWTRNFSIAKITDANKKGKLLKM